MFGSNELKGIFTTKNGSKEWFVDSESPTFLGKSRLKALNWTILAYSRIESAFIWSSVFQKKKIQFDLE